MLNWNNEVDGLILFHGSTDIIRVNDIDLRMTKETSDFGRGFYTTTSNIQARRWAEKLSNIKKKYPIINKYLYIENKELKIKEFSYSNIEWLDMVVYNRTKKYNKLDIKQEMQYESYDIVIGPVADDNTNLVIKNFIYGLYGEISSLRAKNFVIELLETFKLDNQFCFKTLKSLECLSDLEV